MQGKILKILIGKPIRNTSPDSTNQDSDVLPCDFQITVQSHDNDVIGNHGKHNNKFKCVKINGRINVANNVQLDLMFMKHYAPNRCLYMYIKVAKLRTGVGRAETSYLQNCSVKLFKEHFKV